MSVVRACPSCASKNRVPGAHLHDTGRCGRCRAALPPLDDVVDVDAAQLSSLLAEARVPVLVDFWAPWCAPCRLAAPEVKKAAHALAGRAVVVKVNTDEHPAAAQQFGVRGIPMFTVVNQGRVVQQQTGLVDAARLVAMVPRPS
jgi:thioredoxin 2